MSEFKLSGKITAVMEEKSGQTKNGKGWRTKQFVLHIDGQYPKDVAMIASGAACDRVSNGVDITAYFDISSRQWNDKWITEARVYKIEN